MAEKSTVVPPSGGSLEIGNFLEVQEPRFEDWCLFPLRGDP